MRPTSVDKLHLQPWRAGWQADGDGQAWGGRGIQPRHRRRVVLNFGEPQALWRNALHSQVPQRVAHH